MFQSNQLSSNQLRETLEANLKEGEQTAELTKLEKVLSQEDKENYAGWLNDPITKKVLCSLEEELDRNNAKLLTHCLGTGIDRPVDDRKVLYHSLKNRIIEELLRSLRKRS